MPKISQATIRDLRVPDLPVDRQHEIENAVADRQANLDAASDRLVALRARLAEYRDALITEAVTGQLDVTAVGDAQMDERLHAVRESAQSEIVSA